MSKKVKHYKTPRYIIIPTDWLKSYLKYWRVLKIHGLNELDNYIFGGKVYLDTKLVGRLVKSRYTIRECKESNLLEIKRK